MAKREVKDGWARRTGMQARRAVEPARSGVSPARNIQDVAGLQGEVLDGTGESPPLPGEPTMQAPVQRAARGETISISEPGRPNFAVGLVIGS